MMMTFPLFRFRLMNSIFFLLLCPFVDSITKTSCFTDCYPVIYREDCIDCLKVKKIPRVIKKFIKQHFKARQILDFQTTAYVTTDIAVTSSTSSEATSTIIENSHKTKLWKLWDLVGC